MATTARKPEYVTERLGPLAKPGTIDREKGIVYGVRVVTRESANRRSYPVAVLRRCARAYEGRVVNVGHRKRPDDYDDPLVKFGELRNVSADDGGLVGDLHFNPKHTFAEPFLWACENNPGLYALSHHARVLWAAKPDADGRQVAESIEEVASVDIVSVGGTTKSVFEALGDTPMTPAEVAATITDAAALDSFLKDLFAALTLDAAAKQAAAQTLMDSLANEPADPAADPMAALESLQRRGKVGKWASGKLNDYFTKEAQESARTKALQLCKDGGLSDSQVSDVFLETVTESRDESRAKALIAERKALMAGTVITSTKRDNPPRTTTPGSGAKKSVDDIIAELDV